MFSEKEMSMALERLYAMYEEEDLIEACPDDYEGYDEDNHRTHCAFDLPMEDICQGLASRISHPVQFRTHGELYRSFNYEGVSLFGQSAAMIADELKSSSAGAYLANRYMELWLLEDGRLMNVESVKIRVVDQERKDYTIEYRRVIDELKTGGDILLQFDSILGELQNLCENQWEGFATIYAI